LPLSEKRRAANVVERHLHLCHFMTFLCRTTLKVRSSKKEVFLKKKPLHFGKNVTFSSTRFQNPEKGLLRRFYFLDKKGFYLQLKKKVDVILQNKFGVKIQTLQVATWFRI